MFEIREYQEDRESPYGVWFNQLDGVTAARVVTHVKRMEAGNFGNSKPVGKGVSELKINFGAGYRVYYGRDGDRLIILVGGGSKRGQSSDISKAIERWARYKRLRRQERAEETPVKKRRKRT